MTACAKDNRWVERILSLKETYRLRAVSTYADIKSGFDGRALLALEFAIGRFKLPHGLGKHMQRMESRRKMRRISILGATLLLLKKLL
jgi:hypothetical protein